MPGVRLLVSAAAKVSVQSVIAAPAAAEVDPLFPQMTAGVPTETVLSPDQIIAASVSVDTNPQPNVPSPLGV